MPETRQVAFSHKEVAAALVKEAGLHEGIWAVSIEFGLQAGNVGSTKEPGSDVLPAAIIPVISIGLHKADKETALSVDAAVVNPAVDSVDA